MTSKHRHGTGTYAVAGDTDARLTALESAVKALQTPPVVVTTPTPPAPAIVSKPAASVADIKALLRDDTVDEIVVRNGTYAVATAGQQAATSLWMGEFAGRARPVLVRAETDGGVIFDGGGAGYFGGITFAGGAHDQEWRGFNFANGKPTETGVIVFGGYGLASPHHITLRKTTILPSIVASTPQNDHCLYFSSDAPHDILIEDYTATPDKSIRSALQFYHDENGGNVSNLVVRRMTVQGTQNAILAYAGTAHDVLIEDSTIANASVAALNMARCGANVVLRRVVSTNSGGTYFPNGYPVGLTLDSCVLA